ncbi:MAG: DNA polymerase III subunit gamma/tau [Candidatus Neomarinimicrobiota bacterium]
MSKNYQILALKWRPKHFEEVVGQDHITKTLIKAFEKNRIAQAFLFAGPRGVGKTTAARLLAMCLNGSDKPSIKYDVESDVIKQIIEGRSMDVIEIDGASNRGIDEIRELRENIKFAPLEGKFKVVIIDEVHMLTTQAFNALLKTLEEPPSHVKFVMATTDIHKVPQTIISRCQRFDFLPITNEVIKDRLKHILKAESVKIDDSSLDLIASKSDGSMRDALGFLDQILVFSDKKITDEIVIDLLGVIPTEIYFNITNALHDKNGEELVTILNHVKEKGYIVEDLIKGLINHMRNLTLMHYKNGLDLMGLSPELKKLYKKNKYDWSLKDLVRISNSLSELYASIKRFSDQTLIFEMTLMKFLQFDKSVDIEKFLQSNVPQEEHSIPEPKKTNSVPKKTVKKTVEKTTKKISAITTDQVKDSWDKILGKISEERGSVHALLSDCIIKEMNGNNLELISYDSNEFNQQLINDNLGFVKDSINEVLNASIGVKIIVDTEVEKIEEKPDNDSVNQNDVVELFQGKDTM